MYVPPISKDIELHICKTSSDIIYFGIDPGYSGAIAIYTDGVWTYKYCPRKVKDIYDIIRNIKNTAWIDNVKVKGVIEKVWARPTDARASAFKFGYNYGAWKTSLDSNNIEYHEVTPQVWMKNYNLPKDKKDRKNTLKKMALDITTDMKITLKNADAVMICNWLIKEENK